LVSAYLGGESNVTEEDEMPAQNGHARDHVLREIRVEIRDLASKGMSAEAIDRHLNGHRRLTEAEQGMVDLLTYHAVAEVNGHY
jgi:hypothetical protein